MAVRESEFCRSWTYRSWEQPSPRDNHRWPTYFKSHLTPALGSLRRTEQNIR